MGNNTIVFASDRKFVLPLAISLSSLAKVSGSNPDFKVIVLEHGLTTRDRDLLAESFPSTRVSFIEVNMESLSDLKSQVRLGPMTYARLMAPGLVHSSVTRLIYCDADVLFRQPVDELFNIDLEGLPLAACVDAGNPVVSFPWGVSDWHELGLDAKTSFFNAGLLVIDVERWNEMSISEQVFEYCEVRGDSLNFADQDGLNAVIAGQFRPLPLRWNSTTALRHGHNFSYAFLDRNQVETAVLDPALIHFTGFGPKPWESGCVDAFRSEWIDVYQESQFRSRLGVIPMTKRLRALIRGAIRSIAQRTGLL